MICFHCHIKNGLYASALVSANIHVRRVLADICTVVSLHVFNGLTKRQRHIYQFSMYRTVEDKRIWTVTEVTSLFLCILLRGCTNVCIATSFSSRSSNCPIVLMVICVISNHFLSCSTNQQTHEKKQCATHSLDLDDCTLSAFAALGMLRFSRNPFSE